jgi:hypothetical protein
MLAPISRELFGLAAPDVMSSMEALDKAALLFGARDDEERLRRLIDDRRTEDTNILGKVSIVAAILAHVARLYRPRPGKSFAEVDTPERRASRGPWPRKSRRNREKGPRSESAWAAWSARQT